MLNHLLDDYRGKRVLLLAFPVIFYVIFFNLLPGLLRQVFINVIDNAIKYSEAGSEISITAEELGENVKITIKDTGCGIKAEDLPKIKTKFFKANTTKRGSGIGLAVADEIINMHSGTLMVTSKENIGTTVEIILPAKKTDSEQVEIVNATGTVEGEN